jgi:DGQHR domain-containing protein
MTTYTFHAVRAKQADGHDIFSFAATPEQVLAFSEIERVGRHNNGELKGFQRHQIASHIKEIRDYLGREDAILPNAVIVAFIEGVTLVEEKNGVLKVTIDASKIKPGFVVDGQQRLTALSGIQKPGFQVFVSALVCKDYNELRQQFVLINNTRPLPKTLIYELLPNVEGLPQRFTSKRFAAQIVNRLNFTPNSALLGQIRQHTNPQGTISDTAMQKFVMNSASNGAMREFIKFEDFEDRSYSIVNEFFEAIKVVFGPEWVGMSPLTSRLRHGAGIVAMGFVMESLYASDDATTRDGFIPGLELLKPYTAWTSGQWEMKDGSFRPWNKIQNTPIDVTELIDSLLKSLKKARRRYFQVVNG